MSDKPLNARNFIEDVLPELIASLGVVEARAISTETTRRMGSGGPVRQYALLMAEVVQARGERAMAAYNRGLDKWLAR